MKSQKSLKHLQLNSWDYNEYLFFREEKHLIWLLVVNKKTFEAELDELREVFSEVGDTNFGSETVFLHDILNSPGFGNVENQITLNI